MVSHTECKRAGTKKEKEKGVGQEEKRCGSVSFLAISEQFSSRPVALVFGDVFKNTGQLVF